MSQRAITCCIFRPLTQKMGLFNSVSGQIGRIKMDGYPNEQAINLIFEPTAGLLERYGRFADKDELEAAQVRVEQLQQALHLAHSRSDIYEAYCTRQELRRLNQELQESLTAYKRQRLVGI